MKLLLTIFFLSFLLGACQKEGQKPIVSDDSEKQTKTSSDEDCANGEKVENNDFSDKNDNSEKLDLSSGDEQGCSL